MTDQDFYSDPAIIADSRSYFDAMRAKGPIVREPFWNSLIVTGYDEVMEVLVNKDGVYSSTCSILGPNPGLPFEPAPPDCLRWCRRSAPRQAHGYHATQAR